MWKKVTQTLFPQENACNLGPEDPLWEGYSQG
jgi:hypothetical protein